MGPKKPGHYYVRNVMSCHDELTCLPFVCPPPPTPSLFQHTLIAIRSRLTPYFVIKHATRGKLPGPFGKLSPSSLRRLALDVVTSLCSESGEMRDGNAVVDLIAAVHEAVVDHDEQAYWESVMNR